MYVTSVTDWILERLPKPSRILLEKEPGEISMHGLVFRGNEVRGTTGIDFWRDYLDIAQLNERGILIHAMLGMGIECPHDAMREQYDNCLGRKKAIVARSDLLPEEFGRITEMAGDGLCLVQYGKGNCITVADWNNECRMHYGITASDLERRCWHQWDGRACNMIEESAARKTLENIISQAQERILADKSFDVLHLPEPQFPRLDIVRTGR